MSVRRERSAEVGFAHNPLDRLSEGRDDAAFVESLRADPRSRTLVLSGDVPLLREMSGGHVATFSLAEAAGLGTVRETALLGRDESGALFATLIEADTPELSQGRALAKIDLRSIATAGLLTPALTGALGQAKSLMYWHKRHRFCGNCGSPTQVEAAGWRRVCPACGALHFPRTDPVVIMLAVSGDRCLLGRQAKFPPQMYSCLAGFLEAGETMEDAVRREIHEEAGIEIGAVRYVASQPWPFPASLMLGAIAEALSTALVVDATELEDARWFTRADCADMLAGRSRNGVEAPNPVAIAHHILRAWVEGDEP